jgi:hypothetical protein
VAADTVAKTEQVLSAHAPAATQLQLKPQRSIASEGSFEFLFSWQEWVHTTKMSAARPLYLPTFSHLFDCQ